MNEWTDEVTDQEAFFADGEEATVALATDPSLPVEHLALINHWLEEARLAHDTRLWETDNLRTGWGLRLFTGLIGNPNVPLETLMRWIGREIGHLSPRGWQGHGFRSLEALFTNPARPFWVLMAEWAPHEKSLVRQVMQKYFAPFAQVAHKPALRPALRAFFDEATAALPAIGRHDARQEVQRRFDLPANHPLYDPDPRAIFRQADSAMESALVGSSAGTSSEARGTARLALVRMRVQEINGYPHDIATLAPVFWAWLLSTAEVEWPSLRPRKPK